MNRKTRMITGANGVVVVLLTIAIVFVLNAIMSGIPVPLDLTENQIYTLSDASKRAVEDLDEPIQVKVFISPDLPAPFHILGQQIGDLLEDYTAASDDKLSYQIISPSADDTDAEEAARGYGIEKVGIGQQTEDQVSLRAVFKGVAFIKGEKSYVIRDLQATGNPEFDNFEYEFTKAILNIRDTEPRQIGFLAGFGGPAANPQFAQAVQGAFSQLYGDLIEVQSIDIASTGKVPEEVEALVILNIDETVSDDGKFAIDQFLQRGGSVGWYQSASGIDQQMAQQLMQQLGPNAQIPDIRVPLNTGLDELIGSYGLTLRQDIVLDRPNALTFGIVMTERGPARVSHPASFLMTDIDRSLPFTRDISTIAMPAPSSIEVDPSLNDKPDIAVFELIKTASTAVRRLRPPSALGYQTLLTAEPDEEAGPFVIAAALRGQLPSYYSTNPLPSGKTEADLAQGTSADARLLVVGSGEFFNPNPEVGFNEQLAGLGGQFLISSLEWLVQDTSLTSIRGKKMPRLVGEVPKDIQTKIQIINIAVVPFLFALCGLWTLRRRRSRRERFTL
jgi:ABC-2 type transport system permease protein